MKTLKKLSIPLLVICIAAYFFIKYQPAKIEFKDLQIVQINGQDVDLNVFKNKPLIVNFWATWCGECIEEMPDFQKAQMELSDKVNFIYISEESPDVILNALRKRNFRGNFYISKKPFGKLGVNTWPVSYFYNSDGKLVNTIKGGTNYKELMKPIL